MKFTFFRKLQEVIKRMRLVDFFLIIFMIILMGESVYNLFSHQIATQDRDAIDIVMRTTMAGIFGYFISANFLNVAKAPEVPASKEVAQVKELSQVQELSQVPEGNTIEPEALDVEWEGISCETKVASKKIGCRVRQQIIIVSSLGLVSLILLIIVRNTNGVTQSAIASVSQLRDFLSTSVGLLIGHSTKETSR